MFSTQNNNRVRCCTNEYDHIIVDNIWDGFRKVCSYDNQNDVSEGCFEVPCMVYAYFSTLTRAIISQQLRLRVFDLLCTNRFVMIHDDLRFFNQILKADFFGWMHKLLVNIIKWVHRYWSWKITTMHHPSSLGIQLWHKGFRKSSVQNDFACRRSLFERDRQVLLQDQEPFPDTFGYSAPTGFISSFGLKTVSLLRRGHFGFSSTL